MFLAKKLNKGAGSPAAPADAQFNYVTMLLHGDGTNGAQNNTFLDSSTNNFTITRNGNTTQGSFSPYGDNWSNYLSGYLTTANTSAFKVGTGDFTVEFWAYWIDQGTGSYYAVTSMGSNSLNIQNQFGTFNVQFEGISNVINFSLTPYYNSWNHFAVVRQSGTTKVYVNGSVVATASDTNNYQGSDPLNIGLRTGGGYLNSYISNLRVCKSAVYTSTFTPSTAPLTTTSQGASNCTILMCQSNRFIDNSASALVFTVGGGTPSVQRFNPFGASTAYSTSVIGGSGYFDGSGDSLQATAGAVPAIGTSDFIISGWWYLNELKDYQILFDFRNGSNSEAAPYIYVPVSGIADYYVNSTSHNFSVALKAKQWSYVLVSRVSGVTKIFLNGTEVVSYSDSVTYIAGRLTLGFNNNSSTAYYYNGYISDFKVVIGSGTTSGTPTTTPATATSGTQALLSMTNGAIFDNAMMNDLETVGNAQISTSVVKYGTGSIYFDGAGDYLITPSVNSNSLGAGDFTIECWAYVITFGSYRTLVSFGDYANTNGAIVYISATGQLRFYNAGFSELISSSTISINTWNHFAVTRSGGTVRVFINGTVLASGTITSDISSPQTRVGIGIYTGILDTDSMYGYIDDLRITKGYARYTATFTPPTAAFPNIGPI